MKKIYALLVVCVFSTSAWACHGLPLMSLQATTNSTDILVTASSDPASCGCGPYYMQVEVSPTNTFTGSTPGNNSSSWGNYPWYRSLLNIPGYSAPNWNDQCVIEPYDTIFIPLAMFCPGSTVYLRVREYVEGSASAGPWQTISVVTPGTPVPFNGWAYSPDPVLCGADTTTLNVMHNGCSGNYTAVWSPSTGLSNPNVINPLAYPAVTTTYTVMLTDNSNAQWFTSSITLYSYSQGLSATVSGTVAGCSSFDASMVATISGGTPPLSYLWMPSGDSTATVTGVGPNQYTFTVTDANGCADTAQLWIIDSCQLVWPGDCNRDSIADMNDIFTIGYYYGNTGPSRPNASLSWVGQPCAFWNTQMANGADEKSVDSNGDGVVDGNDTTAVLQNFAMTHANRWMQPNVIQAAPTLSIDCVPDSVAPLQWGTFVISLGDALNPADSVFGISFILNYDEQYIDPNSLHVSAATSWMGTVGSDLIAVQKVIIGPGQMHVALVRTNHTETSGNGIIAAITFRATSFLVGSGQSVYTPVTISNVNCINMNQNPLTVNMGGDSLVISDLLTGMNNNFTSSFIAYPNPANEEINLQFNSSAEREIRMYNAAGQLQATWHSTGSSMKLNPGEVAAGLYYLQVDSGESVSGQRIMISRQ